MTSSTPRTLEIGFLGARAFGTAGRRCATREFQETDETRIELTP